MSKFIGDDVSVVVDGVDLSDHVKSADVKDSYSTVDLTGMGADAHEMGLAKAKTSTMDIEFFADYEAAAVEATLQPLAGSKTPFTVVVKPTSDSVSATNPSYTMVALLPEWESVVAPGVGEASVPKASFVCGDSTGIVKATS